MINGRCGLPWFGLPLQTYVGTDLCQTQTDQNTQFFFFYYFIMFCPFFRDAQASFNSTIKFFKKNPFYNERKSFRSEKSIILIYEMKWK